MKGMGLRCSGRRNLPGTSERGPGGTQDIGAFCLRWVPRERPGIRPRYLSAANGDEHSQAPPSIFLVMRERLRQCRLGVERKTNNKNVTTLTVQTRMRPYVCALMTG